MGAVNITASSYGNGITYNPEYAASSAIDNNFDTAWITGTFVPDPAGQWWQAQFAEPGHHEPHHARPAAAGRPLALDLLRHPHVRREGPASISSSRAPPMRNRADPHLPHRSPSTRCG